MIHRIRLKNVLPNVFVGASPEGGPSDIWEKEVTFDKGKSYLIEAASGRGKSSFCAYLFALRSDYQGSIEWIDEKENPLLLDEKGIDKLRCEGIGMMFQEHRLFPELTAMENVLLKNALTHFTTEEHIRQMLIRMGVHDRLDVPCGRLSFGQQQRVAFVRLLCQPADFLLLDEPVSHLDIENAKIMADMLCEYQAKSNAGIIVTSIGHRMPYSYDQLLKL